MPERTPQRDHPVDRLIGVMRRLRDPETGCPWDIEQTYRTIAPYTIEEAYEVADAIERGAWDDLRGELGDLLLQVAYHAQMAAEDGHFDFGDVARDIADKMVRRHPHVFGDEGDGRSADEQTAAWEARKAAERAASGARGTLDGVALGLPALTRAAKIQRRLARVGFDWPDVDGVADKVAEEAAELARAAEGDGDGDVEEEIGDMLFSLVNLARHLDVDPEAALRRTLAKVERRFRHVEEELARRNRRPHESDLAEMDALWSAAKSPPRQEG
jgi:ATP diphosphatase